MPPWDLYSFCCVRLRSGNKKRGGCRGRWCGVFFCCCFSRPVIFGSSVKSVRGQPVRQDSAGALGICSYQQERSALQSLQGGEEEGRRAWSWGREAWRDEQERGGLIKQDAATRLHLPHPCAPNPPTLLSIPQLSSWGLCAAGVVKADRWAQRWRRVYFAFYLFGGRQNPIKQIFLSKCLSGRKWFAVVIILKKKYVKVSKSCTMNSRFKRISS